jgi:hypothetical protein
MIFKIYFPPSIATSVHRASTDEILRNVAVEWLRSVTEMHADDIDVDPKQNRMWANANF